MSGIDAAMWYLDRPTHPMVGCTVYVLDTSGSSAWSFDRLRDHLQLLSRYAQDAQRRVVEVPYGLAHPGWLIDGAPFDVEKHVRRVTLLDDVGRAGFEGTIAAEIRRMMDPSEPFWTWVVVENLASDRVGLIQLGHHASNDGLSAAQNIEHICVPADVLARAEPVEPTPGGVPARAEILRWGVEQRRARWRRVPGEARELIRALRSLLVRSRSHDRVPFVTGVPVVYWNGEVGARRSAVTTSVDLAALKGLARSLDVALNDVLLAAIGGALRDHLLERDELPARSLIAGCPLALRDPRDAGADRAGNRWSAMRIPLGTDVADFATRCQAIGASTSAIKDARSTGASAWAAVVEHIPGWAYRAGLTLAERVRLTDWMPPMVHAVVSNSRGPAEPLQLGGHEITEMYFCPPLFFGRAMTWAALSYAGQLFISLVTDPDRVADGPSIVARVDQQLAAAVADRRVGAVAGSGHPAMPTDLAPNHERTARG